MPTFVERAPNFVKSLITLTGRQLNFAPIAALAGRQLNSISLGKNIPQPPTQPINVAAPIPDAPELVDPKATPATPTMPTDLNATMQAIQAQVPATPSVAEYMQQAPDPAQAPGLLSAVMQAADPWIGKATMDVTPNMLASYRLSQILSQDSPLLQVARTRADQQAQARGLINSSLASTGALEAMASVAAPLAQHEAETYRTAAERNAAFKQAIGAAALQAAANYGQLGLQASLGLQTDLISRAQAYQQQLGLTSMETAAELAKQDLAYRQQADLLQRQHLQKLYELRQSTAYQMTTDSHRARLEQSLIAARANAEAQLNRQKFEQTWTLAQQDAQLKQALIGTEYGWRMMQVALEGEQQGELAQLTESFAGQRQVIASSSQIFATVMDKIGNLLADRYLSAEARARLIAQQMEQLRAYKSFLNDLGAWSMP